MINCSLGLLASRVLAVVILAAVWLLVFVLKKVAKARSLSRHTGWTVYKKRSG